MRKEGGLEQYKGLVNEVKETKNEPEKSKSSTKQKNVDDKKDDTKNPDKK